MPRGVLFIGGRGPEPEYIDRILHSDDLICAADSGLDAALAAGIRPAGIVGDFDSISDLKLLEDFPPETVQRYPADKDDTDTELGLTWLRSRGCDPIILIGGGEGRLDHSLAILNLFGRKGHPAAWYTAVEEVRPLEGTAVLDGSRGSSVSVAAIGAGPWKLRSSGLDWPLDGVAWSSGAMSLSNRLSGSRAELIVESGTFLCLRPLSEV